MNINVGPRKSMENDTTTTTHRRHSDHGLAKIGTDSISVARASKIGHDVLEARKSTRQDTYSSKRTSTRTNTNTTNVK